MKKMNRQQIARLFKVRGRSKFDIKPPAHFPKIFLPEAIDALLQTRDAKWSGDASSLWDALQPHLPPEMKGVYCKNDMAGFRAKILSDEVRSTCAGLNIYVCEDSNDPRNHILITRGLPKRNAGRIFYCP